MATLKRPRGTVSVRGSWNRQLYRVAEITTSPPNSFCPRPLLILARSGFLLFYPEGHRRSSAGGRWVGASLPGRNARLTVPTPPRHSARSCWLVFDDPAVDAAAGSRLQRTLAQMANRTRFRYGRRLSGFPRYFLWGLATKTGAEHAGAGLSGLHVRRVRRHRRSAPQGKIAVPEQAALR